MTLLIKAEADPRNLVGLLRETIHQIDPNLPVYDVRKMDQMLAGSLISADSP
jgi:hypothetical protein